MTVQDVGALSVGDDGLPLMHDFVLAPSSAAAASRKPREQARLRRHVSGRIAVWVLRSAILLPFIFMAPEVTALILGRPGAQANVSASTADVLGTSSFLLFVTMLAVTPLHTLTGWRWHLVLRRDFGIAMFFSAGLDLTLAALTTGDTFPGGPLGRIAGKTFLVFGTLSVFLLIPLTLTANRRAMRWLGGHWKAVQRLTYVLWATILIHLAFLFGLSSFFLAALAVSAPLAVMRIPPVRRWWHRSRTEHRRRMARAAIGVVLIGVFAVGYGEFVHELAIKGSAAFGQQPANDG
jgi:methionine sulfoxide reductase heme-binding subunit